MISLGSGLAACSCFYGIFHYLESSGTENTGTAKSTHSSVAHIKEERSLDAHPNVIVIMTDDQGWGDMSIHGNTNLETPNIDQLAIEGAQFNQFYVQPVCSPTRAELLTGRYHPRSGVFGTSQGGERIDAGETTMGDVFSKAGYATAAFGKWHSGQQYPYHPNARGFDEFYGFTSGHWGDYFSPPLDHNNEIVKGNGYVPNDITGRAIDFMRKNQNRPFFIHIAQITPHTPLQVPDLWWNRFSEKDLDMYADDRYEEDIPFTRAVLAMCENIDWNVGRVMDALKNMGLDDDTIVVFMNDNGPNSWRWNGGYRGRKGSTDEGGVISPLFIRWPDSIEPGSEIDEVAGVIDVLPTLADLAGIGLKTEHPVDGKSLKPLLSLLDEDNDHTARIDTVDWDDRMIFSYWAGNTSARNSQYRLDAQGRLYDMVDDPGQHNDISNEKPEIREAMLEAVYEWESAVLPDPDIEDRPFTVGHPEARQTHLPARDGVGKGGVKRSNRWPNSSFFTNWTHPDDKIVWDIEVVAEGFFDVEIHYTCHPEHVGSRFDLSFGTSRVFGKITEGHDPPLRGMENDRVEREESYVKTFRPLQIGQIYLQEGKGRLILQATHVPGEQVMDFNHLVLTRRNMTQ